MAWKSTRAAPVRRVAVVAYHSSPLDSPGAGDAGGMSVYVREVAAAHSYSGVHTDIFTRSSSGSGVQSLCEGVRVISIDAGPREPIPKEGLPRYIPEFTAGVKAFSAMQRIAYDVVHSHYWQSGLAALPLRATWSVPLVHSQHTLALVKNRYLAPRDRPDPQARIDGERRVLESADVLIASTDDEWQQLSCLYGAAHDRLKTLHPGVNHRVFRPGDRTAARKRLNLDSEGAVLLWVGRIQPLKGLEVALRAVADLARLRAGDVTLLIVGGPSGPSGERELERLLDLRAELRLENEVRFLGPQAHSRLPDFYNAADALVVCSRSESFGLSALEAHACGLPVVATAVGGLAHVVHNGLSGWLIQEARPSTFAAKLENLLTDHALRRSFSDAAVASARRFSWNRTADELMDLYTCLVESRAPEVCTC
jgi:D-inositol-3-phosphate glycosyltransferase